MHSTMYNGIKMAKKITHDCGQKSIDSVTWTRKFYECVSNRYKFVTLIKKIIFKIESNCIQACVASEKKSTRSSAL